MRGIALTLVGSLAGLALALGVGVAFGWASPPWWGGKAMFPLIIGSATLIVGAVPFYGILNLAMRWTLRPPRPRPQRVACFIYGVLIGGALLPMFLLLGFLGRHGVFRAPAFEQFGLHPL